MSNSPKQVQKMIQQRDRLKAQIVAVGDFRPGSLVERYRRCGKPTCRCAQEGARGHGPSWSLTRAVGGRTVTRVIPAAAVETTRQQIAEYRRFRALVRELVETSERLCDTRLKASETGPAEGAKKGASRRRSTRKSSPKWTPS